MTANESSQPPPLIEPLTRREREVLGLLAEGHSAPEIAAKLTVALSSVKTHIQNLYGKLGVNSKRQAVERARAMGLFGLAPLPASGDAQAQRQRALPEEVTRFFGREADIEAVRQQMADWRLVTLTGSGGVGKSRLALRLATLCQADYPNGVYFVELAAIEGGARVVAQAAHELDVPIIGLNSPEEALAAFLRPRPTLLILDNCEHVLAHCAHLALTLLRTCPRLRILASSREPLGIPGEAVFVVPSLPFPDPHRLPVTADTETFPALALFLDRVRAVVPGYALTPRNARALARICQRLDGIPLALEMAAARLRMLDAETLANRLDSTFQLLTNTQRTALPRHQTMRATMEWSYQLLSDEERLLLARLSIFAGGWSLAAAEAVCSGDGLDEASVFDRLTSLVDKSIVISARRLGEDTRYYLLEMVRQFAREQMPTSDEWDRLRHRHWEYFARLPEPHWGALLSKERAQHQKHCLPEVENLRQALKWVFEATGRLELAVKLLLAWQTVWFIWSRHELRSWMVKGVERLDHERIDPVLEAQFLAWAAVGVGHHHRAREMAEHSLVLSRGLGPQHRETLCWSLWALAVGGFYMEFAEDHWDRAEALLDEQDALIPTLGSDTRLDPRLYRGYNLWLRAGLANYRQEPARAGALARESIRVFEACGADLHLVGPYIALGDAALRDGQFDEAHECFDAALRFAVNTHDVRFVDCLVLLCETEYRRGDLKRAFDYCRDYLRNSDDIWSLERLEMAARIFARAGRYVDAARLSSAAEALSGTSCPRSTSTATHQTSYYGYAHTRLADLSLDDLVPGWPNRPDRDQIQRAWDESRMLTLKEVRAWALNDLVL